MLKCGLVFVLLSIFSCTTSFGFKFKEENYAFVLSKNSDPGVIGKVEVRPNSGATYRLLEDSKIISIQEISGKLELQKHLDEETTNDLNNTELTIQATSGKTSKQAHVTAKLSIIVVEEHYGDQFVPMSESKAESLEKDDKELSKKVDKEAKLSERLSRKLRKISKMGKKMSMAQTKCEMTVKIIRLLIQLVFERSYGDGYSVNVWIKDSHLVSEEKWKHTPCVESCEELPIPFCPPNPYRTINGQCNNVKYPNQGAANTAFERIQPATYFDIDGVNDPISYPNQPDAPNIPSAFKIAKEFIQDEVAASAVSKTMTHAVMQFGQFLDHDIDRTVDSEESNHCLFVSCTGSDSDFVPPCYPIIPLDDSMNCIKLVRSAAVCNKDTKSMPVRQQINGITSYIDGSQIYGSDDGTAWKLRDIGQHDKGLLRVSQGPDGDLPPLVSEEEAERQLCENCFFTGDVRANEQGGLLSFHSLFIREHNRIAKELKCLNNHWTGEKVYQETRKIVGAILQHITYEEFLPVIIGKDTLPQYVDYDKYVNAGIINAFATATFRFGHSLVRSQFDLLDPNFNHISPKKVELRFMFFNNTVIVERGISPLLYGIVGNNSENVDRILSSGILDHLFEKPHSPGENLAARNIQRSRDHGLPGYNKFRIFCELTDAKTLEDTINEITSAVNRQILKDLYYDNPDLIELWVGGLAETPVNGASVGPTFQCIIAEQFKRIRDGDSFFYKRPGVFTPAQLHEIEKSSLSRVYCDNLKNIVSIQKNAFLAPTEDTPRVTCERIPEINLCHWKEHRPCYHGEWVKGAKCSGKCSSCQCDPHSYGDKCEREEVDTIPWHALILDGDDNVICSGALIKENEIVTSESCAQGLSKDSTVALGMSCCTEKFKIKSEKRKSSLPGIVIITLLKKIKKSHAIKPIKLSTSSPSKSEKRYVSTYGSSSYPQDEDGNLQRVILEEEKDEFCEQIFGKTFDAHNNICTQEASLYEQSSSSSSAVLHGSPLYVEDDGEPLLIGVLTGFEPLTSDKSTGYAMFAKTRK